MDQVPQVGPATPPLPRANWTPPVYPDPASAVSSWSENAGRAAIVTGVVALTAHLLYSFLSSALSSNLHQFRYLFDGLGHLEWVLCGAAVTAGLLGRRSALGKVGLAVGVVVLVLAFMRFGLALAVSL